MSLKDYILYNIFLKPTNQLKNIFSNKKRKEGKENLRCIFIKNVNKRKIYLKHRQTEKFLLNITFTWVPLIIDSNTVRNDRIQCKLLSKIKILSFTKLST